MKKPHHLVLVLLGFVALFSSLAFTWQEDISYSQKHTVRVLSYNIHHAEPPSTPRSIDLEAIAKVIKDLNPDLVALQEVDVYTGRSGAFNQAEELGKMTGLSAHFFKAIDYDGGQYGVAILSRYPVTESHRYPLPGIEGQGGEPRILATATVELSSKEKLLFACTHLDAQKESGNRLVQMKAIAGLLGESSIPVILAGDFNAVPGSEVINLLDEHFHRTCESCEFTIPVDTPNRTLDFITFRPSKTFRVRQHQVIKERYASDHLPVFAVLEIRF